MEWRRNILRKVIITDEIKTRISNEVCIHNRKIQQTEIFKYRMAGDVNHPTKSEACLSEFCTNLNSEESPENTASDESFITLNSVYTNGDNTGTEDVCETLKNIDASVRTNDDSDFQMKEIDSASKENNDSINSEKGALHTTNEGRDNDIGNTDSKLQTNSTTKPFDGNFTESKLSNTRNHIKSKNNRSINKDNVDQNETLKSSSISSKNFKVKTIPSARRKRKNNCIKVNFTGNNMESKFKNSSTDDTYVTNKSNNEENMTKNGFKVNMFSESTVPEIPYKNINEINNVYDSKIINEIMTDSRNENDLLPKMNVVKNIVKKCDSSTFGKMTKRELQRKIHSKSVTDLINYFESLDTSKNSNVNSKAETFESKQSFKKDRITNVSKIINSKAYEPSSMLTISKIEPLTANDENSVTAGDVSEIDSGDGQTVAKKSKTIAHNANLGDKKCSTEIIEDENLVDASLCGKKIFTDENFSQHKELDLNTDIRKTSVQTVSDVPNCNSHNYANMSLSLTKLETCAYCKGKCVHSAEAITHPENYGNKIKEHLFLFPDGVLRETKIPNVPNPRRFRSRFTRKHKLVNQPPYNVPSNLTKGGKSTSDMNKINENGGFTAGNVCDTTVKFCLSDDNINGLSLTQNSIDVQKQERNSSDKKKPKLSFISMRYPKMKCFIGILLAAIIFLIVYKEASEPLIKFAINNFINFN